MKEIVVSSTGELRTTLEGLGGDVLFRGQTAHHLENGHASVVTSFDRRGCIPSQMAKWIRYASNVLKVQVRSAGKSLGFMQALLQHYGWRSFYVDCSENAAVAAWFASHQYSDSNMIELCEDCEERAVMLIKRKARYEFTEGEGHLYVFDKKLIAERIGVVDLSALEIEGARPRTAAQDAWLVGPLRNQEVPIDCFVAHITASRAVFRDFAAETGLVETDNLFPSAKEDPILRALLGLPWKEIEDFDKKLELPFFRRALDLPEYHDSFTKIASPATAFFRGARVAGFGSIDGDKYGGITVHVPELTLFGTADEAPLLFPKVRELLTEHRSVAFEIDELIQHTEMRGTVLYQKGITVTAHEPDLVEVGELMVKHPGLEMTVAGMTVGWYYRIGADGTWTREAHPQQCDCKDDEAHLRHLSALHIVEAYLTDPTNFT